MNLITSTVRLPLTITEKLLEIPWNWAANKLVPPVDIQYDELDGP